MATRIRRSDHPGDDEAARARDLAKRGGLTLDLIGLGVDQFAQVCAAVDRVDLDHAVDSEGRLVVESPDAGQLDDLRRRLRHGRSDLDSAMVLKLRARRGARVIGVDDLTALERDDLVHRLGERGFLAAVDGLDVVVERKGASVVDELVGGGRRSSTVEAEGPNEDDEEPKEPYASQVRRLLGFLIDAAILVLVVVLLVLGAELAGVSAVGGYWLGVTAFTGYDFVTTYRSGQTLGKRLAGTRIVDNASHEPLRWSQAMVRSAVHILPLVLLGTLGILAFAGIHMAILLTPERRGLHDWVARTVVLDVTDGGEG